MTARMFSNAVDGGGVLALRTRFAVRWGVIVGRYDDPAALAAALCDVIERAEHLDPDRRRAAIQHLRRRRAPKQY